METVINSAITVVKTTVGHCYSILTTVVTSDLLFLGLQDRCGAVFARLASTSCVSEDSRERSDKKRQGLSSVLVSKPCPVRLPAAYALSMDVLLDIGLEMGSHSADCWTHVFK